MASDPWHWTALQVAECFRNNAPVLIDDIPNARLPDMNAFAQKIEENDVCGFMLFEEVDTGFLRDECGIKSLGQRGAIKHCIRKLRAQSATCQKEGAPRTPISTAATPSVLPTTEQEPVLSVPISNNPSTKRAGDVQVEDSSGRKRRKLDISKLSTFEPDIQPRPLPASASFLRDSRLPVDEIFFGKTRMGQEICAAEMPSGMMSNPASRPNTPELANSPSDDKDSQVLQKEDTCFQFQATNQLAGESAYVYRQMRRFLALDVAESDSKAVKHIKRHGHDAIAILPYNENLLQDDKAQSALVVQICGEDSNRCTSKRENAAFLESGFDYGNIDGEPADSNSGQWDFLATKYKSTNSDELLPEYGASNTEGSLASLQLEMQKDEAEAEDGKLSGARLESVIDAALTDIASAWKQKFLPVREEKRAWSVWRQTRRSRVIRDGLIEGAERRIQHLEHRVHKFKEEMHRDEWQTEKEVIKQCQAMDLTIQDIEEERWKIDVWQRTREPHHIIKHGERNFPGPKSTNTGKPQKLPLIHPNDRLSVEPDPGADEDDFHSAQGEQSPVPLEGPGQDEDEDASDEASEQDEDADFLDDSASLLAESPNPPIEADVSETAEQDYEMLDPPVESEHSEYEPEFSSPSIAARQSNARRHETQLTDTGGGTESEVLPSPNSFGFQKRVKQENRTPSKSRTFMSSSADAIVISSDSTPGKSKRSKKHDLKYHGEPESATAQDVATWDIDVLKSLLDRKRILIKLLATLIPQQREDIKQSMLGLKRNGYWKQVWNVLKVLRRDFSGSDQDKVVVLSTKLFLAFHFCEPDIYFNGSRQSINWESAISDEASIRYFCQMLALYLDTPGLWPPESKSQSLPGRFSSRGLTKVIDLSSSSDLDDGRLAGTPRKKNQKIVKLNANAEQSQAAAFRRQQKFKEMQSEGSNSKELRAMIQADPSNSTVAINPLASLDDGEDYIFVDKKIASALKEHQIEGIQFMWRELTAQGSDGGQGCILAHTMGLGKTLQTIATLVALNEATRSENPRVYKQVPEHLRPPDIRERQLRMLIILPAALIQNWRREIRTWAPHVFTNIFTVESVPSRRPEQTIDELEGWFNIGGILFMTYGLFQRYANWRDPEAEAKRKPAAKLAPFGTKLDKYLIKGPEIVVADEVHSLKNPKAKVTRAAQSIHTESRIGLTGTPMSNDVDEIYSLVSFAAPNYLGEKTWFNQTYSNPIKEGNRKDSEPSDVRRMLKKLAVLRNQIEPKVHRADINVLRGSLKPKLEFVIIMPLSDIQRVTYKKYLAALSKDESNLNKIVSQTRIFAWLAALTLLMNHPLAFKRKLLMHQTKKTLQRESTPSVSDGGTGTPSPEGIDLEDLDMDEAIQSLAFSNKVKQDIVAGIDDNLRAESSMKMLMLLRIIRHAGKCHDKILVFSGSIPTLDYVEELLRKSHIQCGRIDGSVAISKRQPIINAFHKSENGVLLMSTKAGVGLNIQGANRVVILDFGFNPSHEEQAVGRAYRLGQTKPVFVYRLIIGGTFEDNIYDKQMFKTSLTQRVVDKKNPRRIAFGTAGDWLYEPKETPQDDLQQWLGKDEAVLHKILRRQLKDGESYAGPQIRKLTTIETLQEDAADEPLNEEEQREVKEELAMRRNMRQYEKQAAKAGQSASQAGQSASQAALPRSTPYAFTFAGTPARDRPPIRLKMVTKPVQPHGLPVVGKNRNPPATMPPPPAAVPNSSQQSQYGSAARPSSTGAQPGTHGLPSSF